ncbi:YecA family protein [Pistricoccus aurantiacus]|uniref:YecA family protein n=1 Tax=Pistricoccus aurantiacus TaxID=1883414 RepID=A0A5B8SRW5_9GAMM|nr:YecA family protein [Pistricoccus aurantiacus]QEA39031.1 YecA family protein [Pistricoccus aurantiacus]
MADTNVYQPLLMDADFERLDDFLESDRAPTDALDVIGAHGFLVALAVAPTALSAAHWIGELFQGEPAFADEQERDEILALLETLKVKAAQALELGQLPELPFELTLDGLAPEETPIGDWCAGFMEGVFLDEAAWFAEDEENVAALLLPFMALSGLFDEEPDMQDFIADTQRLEALVSQLPDLVLDLYLHYRVPPEKPKPTARKKRSTRKR